MSPLESALLMVHLLVAVAICGFVLLQHGKGADMGAAFGGGSAGSVFGSAGSANFLSRTTAVLAAVFFFSSIGLTYYGAQHYRARAGGGVMDRVPVEQPAPTKDAAGASGVPVKAPDVPAKAADTTGKAAETAGAAVVAPVTTPAPAPAAPANGAVAPSKAGEVPK